MLYLIGGTSRAGKSTICRLLMKEKKMSLVPLDVMMTTLLEMDNVLNMNYMADSDVIAQDMWAFTKPLLLNLAKHGEDFLIEGISLWPDLVKELEEELEVGSKFEVCFIGYQKLEAEDKLRQMKEDTDQINAWHESDEFDDVELIRQIENIRKISKRLEESCKRNGYQYIESGESVDNLLLEVKKSLKLEV